MTGRPRTYQTDAERQRAYRERKQVQEQKLARQAEKLGQQLERKSARIAQLEAQVKRLKRELEKERSGREAALLMEQDLARAKYSPMWAAGNQLFDAIAQASAREVDLARQILRSSPINTIDALTGFFRGRGGRGRSFSPED
jgi:hypothetical protein